MYCLKYTVDQLMEDMNESIIGLVAGDDVGSCWMQL